MVGFGSAGSRHARLLTELGCDTAVVSSRSVDHPKPFDQLAAAVERHRPQYVVIANATARHFDSVSQLARLGFDGTVLVEKPLFDQVRPVPENRFRAAFVGYNLRFHPVIQRLRSVLEGESVMSVEAYVGQYLPDWREGRSYRDSYSVSRRDGGGVLRDLSHELDYLVWLLGAWSTLAALGGHFSGLEIDSDDVFGLILATSRCPVATVQLNYLDRVGRRRVVVNTDRHTIEADIVQGRVTIDGSAEDVPCDRDESYRSMHRAALSGDSRDICTLEQGMEVMRLIEAAESASERRAWVVA